jgi:hypothetical protein
MQCLESSPNDLADDDHAQCAKLTKGEIVSIWEHPIEHACVAAKHASDSSVKKFQPLSGMSFRRTMVSPKA